jgi:hypothetical protein
MYRKIALVVAAATLSVPIGAAVAGSPAFAVTRTHSVSVDKQHKESAETSKDTSTEGSSNDTAKDTSTEGSSNDTAKDTSTEGSSNDTAKDTSTQGSSNDTTKDTSSIDASGSAAHSAV